MENHARCMAANACQKTDAELRDYPPPSLGLQCPDEYKHSFSAQQNNFCLTEPYSAIQPDGAFFLSIFEHLQVHLGCTSLYGRQYYSSAMDL